LSKCEQCGKSPRGMIILTDLSGKERHLCRDCHNKEIELKITELGEE